MIPALLKAIGHGSRLLATRHPPTDAEAIDAVAQALQCERAQALSFLQFRKTASDQAWSLVWLLAKARFVGLRQTLDRIVCFPDAARWDRLAADRRPCILAAPHLGGYAFAFPAIAARLAGKRVMAFYDDPQHNASNAVFDRLVQAAQRWLPQFEVVHNTRRGLAQVLSRMQQDSCLILMPDIRNTDAAAEVVPFFGHYFPIALGTAQLAERAGAIVYPLLTPLLDGRVHCRLGEPLNGAAPPSGLSAQFALMRELFAQFEALMAGHAEQWDYWSVFPRRHERVPASLQGASSAALLAEIRRLVAAVPELALQVPELGALLHTTPGSIS